MCTFLNQKEMTFTKNVEGALFIRDCPIHLLTSRAILLIFHMVQYLFPSLDIRSCYCLDLLQANILVFIYLRSQNFFRDFSQIVAFSITSGVTIAVRSKRKVKIIFSIGYVVTLKNDISFLCVAKFMTNWVKFSITGKMDLVFHWQSLNAFFSYIGP